MARKGRFAHYTVAETEAWTAKQVGPRGNVTLSTGTRGPVRCWLRRHGMPSPFVNTLSLSDLAWAWNDTTNHFLNTLLQRAGGPVVEDAQADDDDANDMGNDAQHQGEDPMQLNLIHKDDMNQGMNPAVIAQAVASALAGVMQAPRIDPEALRAMVREEIDRQVPKVIEVKRDALPPVKMDGIQHYAFERVLKLVNEGANVLLIGPAGCGKTHLAENIAKALGADYGAIHGTAGASESQLTGWLLPGDGGRFEYAPSPFVSLYERGESLFLFDEIDAFDPNMLLVANGALANGHLHVPHRRENPIVKRGANTRIIATANTYGTGANPMYAGRAALDGSTLDRFIPITVDYDRDLETSIADKLGLTRQERDHLWTLRDKVRNASLRRNISTRAFFKVAQMKRAGDEWTTIKTTLVEGWSKDEKAKVGA